MHACRVVALVPADPRLWIDAKQAGRPADVFALGIVLWELLTLRKPYSELNIHRVGAGSHTRNGSIVSRPRLLVDGSNGTLPQKPLGLLPAC